MRVRLLRLLVSLSPCLLVCSSCLLVCSTAKAASPSLREIQPRGVQRGTEIEATFTGARLGDTKEILVYYPGITVKKFEPVKDNQLKVTLAVTADCRLGEHAFRVRTATGISDLRSLWVGALPAIQETEPNTEFDKPQPIPLNVTVQGVVQSEDVDHFLVECKKGQRLSVEVEGMRLGTAFFDPYVAILDAKRFEMATGDDSPLTAQDGGCSIIIPADGKYIVQVRESAYGGSGDSHYRLHVGNFPRPTAMVPAGGKPGEELEVTFLGDPTGPIKQKVKLPAVNDPNTRLHCRTADGIHPAGIEFRVADLPGVIESGSNDDPKTATAGTAPGAFHGVVSKPDETDYFKFTAKKGQAFEVRCYARKLGSPLDPVMTVGLLGGRSLGNNDDSGGPDSSLRFTAPEDKEYVVSVRDHLKTGGADYFYRIEVTPVEPLVTTTIPRVNGNAPANQERQVIAVPKGNRFACLLSAGRSNFGGPLTMGLEKLPPGMSIAVDTMDAGLNVVPAVFEAKPGAAIGGFLTGITATPTDPKQKVPCKTQFDAVFNIGPNNTPYQRHYFDRTAVAVTEACPFSIEVVEPKVPVVQNGSYNLRVVAKRSPEFKGAITVYPLWTPPGMGIVGSATIPPDKTEATLAMNAAANAATRKWKTAVIAQADYGQGPAWVSSQLFTIEVAPPPVTLTADRPAVEQGKETQLFCKVAVNAAFEGKAKVKLLGLPAKVTTQEAELTKDSKEVSFPISADKTSPAGKHGGIFCQIVIEQHGELITLNTGSTELRIDVPLETKTAAKPAPNQPKPKNQPAKRLSRLEQLRLEQAEREKAGPGGKEPPKKEEPK